MRDGPTQAEGSAAAGSGPSAAASRGAWRGKRDPALAPDWELLCMYTTPEGRRTRHDSGNDGSGSSSSTGLHLPPFSPEGGVSPPMAAMDTGDEDDGSGASAHRAVCTANSFWVAATTISVAATICTALAELKEPATEPTDASGAE
jgi:hypothetical protein